MSDTLIKVEGVSKKFCRSFKRSLWYGMQDLGREVTGRRQGDISELRDDEFWAVKDVSFDLKRGECLGLVGPNGAGKTTLLRMLNGLIKPDKGRIEMRGRVGALIALGAGFNPILTGRENVYVNATVLGLSKKKIDEKLDEIVDFAEIEAFIDSPVQNYSSGMAVRLGFSVAAVLKPDVLLLDEVLAVGDMAFRVKCGNRIREMMSNAAVILVSHSMEFISWYATKVMVMQGGGTKRLTSSVHEGIRVYETLNIQKNAPSGKGGVEMLEAELVNKKQKLKDDVLCYIRRETLHLSLKFFVSDVGVGSCLDIRVGDGSGKVIINYRVVKNNSDSYKIFPPGEHTVCLDLGEIELTGGLYEIMAEFYDENRHVVFKRCDSVARFFVDSDLITYTKVTKNANIL